MVIGKGSFYMDKLWKLSGLELKTKIGLKEIKPSEVMEVVLARIEKVNPKLNAFCTWDPDSAMAQARKADDLMARGKARGLLFGIPVSVKDLIFTKGIRTTFGSKMHESFVPDRDEVVVERLKAAGAIILGKTTTCEFGYKAVTDSPLWGITRNPWDLQMTPAGSSGGAAAAVASGLGPLAVGSDGGGSIRAPASFCGIFGLKPSRGRIPIYPLLAGWEALDRRVAHLGPLTRTVADAALMMEVMTGSDDRDPLSLPGKKISFARELMKGIRGFRIAWSTDLGNTVADPLVRKAVESAAQVFSKTPTLPVTPFPTGIDWPREVAGAKVHPLNYLAFTYPFNLTGQPAASVPCAWTTDGLPIGLQIVGGRCDDLSVLKAAAAFEEAKPWRGKWPKIG
jgi:aspartyl-tRNA(Asn)/glutamyl-tRNA(Gln) amidotransferase subunit A